MDSSSSSDEEDMKKFHEAAAVDFLNDSMFKRDKQCTGNTTYNYLQMYNNQHLNYMSIKR